MKGFLLDENLPRGLRFSLGLPLVSAAELGPSPTDTQLWEFARQRWLYSVKRNEFPPPEASGE